MNPINCCLMTHIYEIRLIEIVEYVHRCTCDEIRSTWVRTSDLECKGQEGNMTLP